MLGREHSSVSILFRYGPTAQSSSNPEFDAAVDRRGPVAVIFHRGHWCPYCRININALVEAHKALPASAENRCHHARSAEIRGRSQTAVPNAVPSRITLHLRSLPDTEAPNRTPEYWVLPYGTAH